MTQPNEAWIKALHAPFSDGTAVSPPREITRVAGPGAPVVTDSPATGETILTFPDAGFAPGGDLGGTGTNQTVEKIQGVAITGTPAAGNVLTATDATDAHWAAPAGGGVASVSGTAPIASSGGTTPAISIAAASSGAAGSMSAADKTKLDTFTPGSPAQGDVMYFDGTHWVSLAPGTAGQFLETQGASANPQWATAGGSVDIGDIFGTSRIEYWAGGYDAGSLSGELNFRLGVAGGSGGSVSASTTSRTTSTAREERQAASSTGFCGFFSATNKNWAWRGNAAGLGGFKLYTSMAIEELNNAATLSVFLGLSSLNGASRPSAANFNTQTTLDAIGFGTDQTTTGGAAFTGNWKIISCDGTTTNLVDSGLPITKGHLYLFMLSCIANDTLITWKITDLTAGTSATGTVNTNLPRNTQFMGWQCGINPSAAGSGGDGSNSISLARYMLETLQ